MGKTAGLCSDELIIRQHQRKQDAEGGQLSTTTIVSMTTYCILEETLADSKLQLQGTNALKLSPFIEIA